MNRFFFAAALTFSTTLVGHALAQERVAKAGAVKPARTAAHTAPAPKAPDAPKAAAPTRGTTASDSSLTVTSSTGVVDQHPGQDLADVRGTSTPTSGSGAEERAVAAVVVSTATVPKPIASPRLLRRMNADRVLIKLSEDFHACYTTESGAKTADFAVVRVQVAPGGDIENAKVESGAVASPTIAACIDESSTRAKFSAPGGIGTIVLVQVHTR